LNPMISKAMLITVRTPILVSLEIFKMQIFYTRQK
jgi:hypothetical protein